MKVLALFVLSAAFAPPLAFAETKNQEICKSPESLLANIAIDRNSKRDAPDFKVVGNRVAYSGSDILRGACAPLASHAVGSAYSFETGIRIRPAVNGNQYQASASTTRFEMTPSVRPSNLREGQELVLEKEIYTDRAGGRVFLGVISDGSVRRIVSFRKKAGAETLSQIEELIETRTPVKSIDWIRFHHGTTGKIFILTNTAPPRNVSFEYAPPDFERKY